MLAFVQIDSASVPLLDQLIDGGRMPVLSELRRRGRVTEMATATDLFEAAIYPTLHCGVEVSDHGLYYPLVWNAEEQRLRYMDRLPTPATVWERIAAVGGSSLVVDPYQLWRSSAGSEGVSLSGWQFRHKVIPSWGLPRAELGRARRRFGAPPLLTDVAGPRTTATMLTMLGVLAGAPSRVADLAADLLRRRSFDFAWLTFTSVHQGGHHLWDLSQLSDEPTPAERRTLEGGLARVYEEADIALGRVVEALPAGADLIVLSPLGMGPNTTRSDMLPDMVARVLGPEASDRARQGEGRSAGGAVWRFRSAMPPTLRRAANRALPRPLLMEILARLYTRGIDWDRTRAVVLPGDHFGYVRLNVKGRERFGSIDPDRSAGVLDELADGLASFEDEHDGSTAAALRFPQRELSGDAREGLPDLVACWSDQPSTSLQAVHSPRFGRIERRSVGNGRSGNHHPGAWALIVPGRSHERDPDRVPDIIDLAATACAAAGCGEDLKGTPLLA